MQEDEVKTPVEGEEVVSNEGATEAEAEEAVESETAPADQVEGTEDEGEKIDPRYGTDEETA